MDDKLKKKMAGVQPVLDEHDANEEEEEFDTLQKQVNEDLTKLKAQAQKGQQPNQATIEDINTHVGAAIHVLQRIAKRAKG